MKKTVLLVVFALVGLTTFAQENKDLKAAVKQIVEKQSGSVMEMPQMKQLMDVIPERNKEAFKSELKAKMEANYNNAVKAYFEVMTKEEITAMVNFYNTSEGKSILEKTPTLTEKTMQYSQGLMMEIQGLFQKYAAQ